MRYCIITGKDHIKLSQVITMDLAHIRNRKRDGQAALSRLALGPLNFSGGQVRGSHVIAQLG